jgi:hypothetical protein
MKFEITIIKLLTPLLLVTLFWACTPQEELVSKSPSLKLMVSNDTVLFDTLLSTRGSMTRRFRVYNPNKSAIRFDEIKLAGMEGSAYSVIINGRPGPLVNNLVVYGKDSIQVLVTVEIDPRNEDLPYLVKDSVTFMWNGNEGHVKLVAYGQDATYLTNTTVCTETWTSARPYVLMGDVLVEEGCTLTMEPGTHIFLDNGARLLVQGTIHAQGTAEQRIIVKNTRFDASYKIAPGQWDGIYFLEGSTANHIAYADIANGRNGLWIRTQDDDNDLDLTVQNTIIRHMAGSGVAAFQSEVRLENTLVYDCRDFLLVGFGGGRYEVDHCTLVNTPSSFFRRSPSVEFSDNLILEDGQVAYADLTVQIRNSIIWGAQTEELRFTKAGATTEVTKNLQQNIYRSVGLHVGGLSSTQTNFPKFKAPGLFDYRLDDGSPAIDHGINIGIPIDLKGNPRDVAPDCGAYEWASGG